MILFCPDCSTDARTVPTALDVATSGLGGCICPECRRVFSWNSRPGAMNKHYADKDALFAGFQKDQRRRADPMTAALVKRIMQER